MIRLTLIGMMLFAAGCGAQGDPIVPATGRLDPGVDTGTEPVTDTESIGAEPITFAL